MLLRNSFTKERGLLSRDGNNSREGARVLWVRGGGGAFRGIELFDLIRECAMSLPVPEDSYCYLCVKADD